MLQLPLQLLSKYTKKCPNLIIEYYPVSKKSDLNHYCYFLIKYNSILI